MEFDGEVRNITMLLTRMRSQLEENREVKSLEDLTAILYYQYSQCENALVDMKYGKQEKGEDAH